MEKFLTNKIEEPVFPEQDFAEIKKIVFRKQAYTLKNITKDNSDETVYKSSGITKDTISLSKSNLFNEFLWDIFSETSNEFNFFSEFLFFDENRLKCPSFKLKRSLKKRLIKYIKFLRSQNCF